MADYISREAAITAVKTHCPAKYETAMLVRLVCIPGADVLPVVHAHWTIKDIYTYELSYGTTAYEPVYECSACKRLTESYLRLDEPRMPVDADFPEYCPHCGARMDESEEDGNV